MPFNHTSPVQPRSRVRRASRALGAILVLGMFSGLALYLGRSRLIHWAGTQAGIDLHVEHVAFNVMEGSIQLYGVHMASEDHAWIAITDVLECSGISRSRAGVNIDRIHLGKLAVTQNEVDSILAHANPDTPMQEGWSELWAGPLEGITLHQMDWEEIHLTTPTNDELHVGSGTCSELACNAEGVRLGNLEWSQVSGTIPTMDVPLELAASSLHGAWTPDGWELETSTLSLPGLSLEGGLAWPQMRGQGRALIEWENVVAWVKDDNISAWLDTLQCRGETTTLEWDLDSAQWTANVEGPSWLNMTASGNANAWGIEASMVHIPNTLKAAIPADSLSLSANGTENAVDVFLLGERDLDLRMHAMVHPNWATWLQSPAPPASAEAHVGAWGHWVSHASQAIEAKLQEEEGVILWDIRQPHSARPWSLAGSFEGLEMDVTARLEDPDSTAEPVAEADFHLTLDSAAKHLSWRGTGHLADVHCPLNGNGHVNWNGVEPTWLLNVTSEGAWIEAQGEDTPNLPDLTSLIERKNTRTNWGDMRIRAEVTPGSEWTSQMMPGATLLDTLSLTVDMDQENMRGRLSMPEVFLSDLSMTGTDLNVTAQGNHLNVSLQSHVHLDTLNKESVAVHANLNGSDLWEGMLTIKPNGRAPFVWRVDAAPASSADHLWDCSLLELTLPIRGDSLCMEDAPLNWTASAACPLPPLVSLSGAKGRLDIKSAVDNRGSTHVNLQGSFCQINEWTQALDSALNLSNVDLEGNWVWGKEVTPRSTLSMRVSNASYEDIQFDEMDVSMSLHKGHLNVLANAVSQATNTSITSQLSCRPFESEPNPTLTASLTEVPFEWAQPWIDSTFVQLEGRLRADLSLEGDWDQPWIQGEGRVDSLKAYVPNLGTHFGGHGNFQMGQGDLWLNNFSLYDALGNMARMEGALVHNQFEDWSFDASLVETPEPLLLMNLPPSNNDVAYGQLVVGGSLDLFYWDGDFDIRGDVSAHKGTDLHLSLLTDEEAGWNSTVEFLKPPSDCSHAHEPDNVQEDELGVLIDLSLEANPDAKITILTDPENNANIVGFTEGTLHVLMDDWEHLTLNGELSIVEGRYDLAFGPFVRKTFVAQPGGRLFWNGDPFQGTLDLDAVYTTRANVQPLLGGENTQVQNEDVEVLVHLSGPMMTPNLTFDLATPLAPPLVSEAVASAVADPSEKTSQAIALLSLQEFLPPQYNSLELGSNGLQDYTVDVVTSQLSQWLSRINDDIDIGIRYDAQRASEEATGNAQQDALQVALRASFLNDRLEVEGAVGSREITQEALGETHLQNIRVLYHLNDEKSLQLTGFSEAQSSATQTANTTSQGVGIRWHRSFNWKWPWSKSDDPQE